MDILQARTALNNPVLNCPPTNEPLFDGPPLQDLPEDSGIEQEIINLRRSGMNQKRITETLNIPPATVAKCLRQARREGQLDGALPIQRARSQHMSQRRRERIRSIVRTLLRAPAGLTTRQIADKLNVPRGTAYQDLRTIQKAGTLWSFSSGRAEEKTWYLAAVERHGRRSGV